MTGEIRKIMDFIMGGCSGFCIFYGGFLGYSVGILMLVTFIISAYRQRMLNSIDVSLKNSEEENVI
jgi:hypothetical protein